MRSIPADSELKRATKAQLLALIGELRAEVASDDRRDDLERMRGDLLAAMEQVEPEDLPKVCRELRAVDAELAGLSTVGTPEQAVVDDLKARRAARRSAS